MSTSKPPRPINLLKYHRPRIHLRKAPIPQLTPESKTCLRRLISYRRPKSALQDVVYPRSRCAAVLVALFVGRMGDLYVLLNRRSSNMRSYAGDTSLPGGKVESEDKTLEDTARREAFEEIGIPRDRAKVPLLCVMEPFLASNQTIVTPVVVLILDNTLRPILNQAEVTSLFSHPLSSFLSSSPPFPTEPEYLHVPYHTYVDFPWPPASSSSPSERPLSEQNQSWRESEGDDQEGDGQDFLHDEEMDRTERRRNEKEAKKMAGKGVIRMHRFLTGREAGGVKPVFGLTASILIQVATIGYHRQPAFDVYPSSTLTSNTTSNSSVSTMYYTYTPTMDQRIAYALITNPLFRQAYQEEGINVNWQHLRDVADIEGRRRNWKAVDGWKDRHGARKKRVRVKSKL